MSWASCTEGLLRAIAVAAACTILGHCGASSLTAAQRIMRSLAWLMAIVCFFAPPLMVGYAYADFTGFVRFSAGARGAFYALLMCARIAPMAAVIWLMCPRQVSAESWFCLRLAWRQLGTRQRARHVWRLLRQDLLASGMVAFGVSFVLAFSEFELASFLGVGQWTVGVFDSQVGGETLGRSLLRVGFPAAVSGSLSAFVILTLGSRRSSARTDEVAVRFRSGVVSSNVGFAWFAVGTLLVAVVPGCIVLGGALPGMCRMGGNFALHRELACSLLVAVTASALACASAKRVLRSPTGVTRPSVPGLSGALLLLAPGLLGGLVLGLCMLALLQAPLVWRLRETPLPLVAAATLLVMPATLLMEQLLRNRTRAADVHLVRLLASSPSPETRRRAASIWWVRRARPSFWMGALLLCLVFYDVTLSTLLAPVRMPLVMPRLYNFMHYGRSQALSASLLVCVLAPIVVLALGGHVYRLWRVRHASIVDD